MKESLISLETAKLLKEKGFVDFSKSPDSIPIIPQSIAQKWLREKHNIYVESLPYNDKELEQTLWENNIIDVKDDWSEFGDYTYYHSYEEALEQAILEALKLVKSV